MAAEPRTMPHPTPAATPSLGQRPAAPRRAASRLPHPPGSRRGCRRLVPLRAGDVRGRRRARLRRRLDRPAPLPERRRPAALRLPVPGGRRPAHPPDPARHRRRHPAAGRPDPRGRGRRLRRHRERRATAAWPRDRRRPADVLGVRPGRGRPPRAVRRGVPHPPDALAGRPINGTEAVLYPPAPTLPERIWEATFSVEGGARIGQHGSGLLLARTSAHPRDPADVVQEPIAQAYLQTFAPLPRAGHGAEGREAAPGGEVVLPRVGMSRTVYAAADRATAMAHLDGGISAWVKTLIEPGRLPDRPQPRGGVRAHLHPLRPPGGGRREHPQRPAPAPLHRLDLPGPARRSDARADPEVA